MRRDEYGYELPGRTPTFEAFDGSIEHKLRQELSIGTGPLIERKTPVKKSTEHIERWESKDGKWLLDLDVESGQLFIPEQFIERFHVAEFAEAVQAARQELEGANVS